MVCGQQVPVGQRSSILLRYQYVAGKFAGLSESRREPANAALTRLMRAEFELVVVVSRGRTGLTAHNEEMAHAEGNNRSFDRWCAYRGFGVHGAAVPVHGFETLYRAARSACSPAGRTAPSTAGCQAALARYAQALVSAGVSPTVELASCTQLLSEVAAAGGGTGVAALFEELLPESGSISPAPTLTGQTPASAGSDGGTTTGPPMAGGSVSPS